MAATTQNSSSAAPVLRQEVGSHDVADQLRQDFDVMDDSNPLALSNDLFRQALERQGAGSVQISEEEQKQADWAKRARERQEEDGQVDIFNTEALRVKQGLSETRQNLLQMNRSTGAPDQAIEQTLISNIADAGTNGTYHTNFFAKVETVVTQLVEAASRALNPSWAGEAKNRQQKQRQVGPGMGTKKVHDAMHHEQQQGRIGQ